MSVPAIRCVLADDHPALLGAVSGYLSRNGFEIVAAVADGVAAVDAVETHRPEVVLVDFRMPKLAGSALIARLRTIVPEIPVAVYTAEADAALVAEALGAGAGALILKEAPLADVARALNELLRGRRYIDAALAVAAAGHSSEPSPELTDRERDVLTLLADGLQHGDIAARLGISAETVRTHLRKATNRLGTTTRTAAVARALRLGLIA